MIFVFYCLRKRAHPYVLVLPWSLFPHSLFLFFPPPSSFTPSCLLFSFGLFYYGESETQILSSPPSTASWESPELLLLFITKGAASPSEIKCPCVLLSRIGLKRYDVRRRTWPNTEPPFLFDRSCSSTPTGEDREDENFVIVDVDNKENGSFVVWIVITLHTSL